MPLRDEGLHLWLASPLAWISVHQTKLTDVAPQYHVQIPSPVSAVCLSHPALTGQSLQNSCNLLSPSLVDFFMRDLLCSKRCIVAPRPKAHFPCPPRILRIPGCKDGTMIRCLQSIPLIQILLFCDAQPCCLQCKPPHDLWFQLRLSSRQPDLVSVA